MRIPQWHQRLQPLLSYRLHLPALCLCQRLQIAFPSPPALFCFYQGCVIVLACWVRKLEGSVLAILPSSSCKLKYLVSNVQAYRQIGQNEMPINLQLPSGMPCQSSVKKCRIAPCVTTTTCSSPSTRSLNHLLASLPLLANLSRAGSNLLPGPLFVQVALTALKSALLPNSSTSFAMGDPVSHGFADTSCRTSSVTMGRRSL